MLQDVSNTIVVKSGKKYNFGQAFYACKCPTCSYLMEWAYLDDGIFEAFCCGKQYEMYCEKVSIKYVGPTNKPNPRIRTRRREYAMLNAKTEVNMELQGLELEQELEDD